MMVIIIMICCYENKRNSFIYHDNHGGNHYRILYQTKFGDSKTQKCFKLITPNFQPPQGVSHHCCHSNLGCHQVNLSASLTRSPSQFSVIQFLSFFFSPPSVLFLARDQELVIFIQLFACTQLFIYLFIFSFSPPPLPSPHHCSGRWPLLLASVMVLQVRFVTGFYLLRAKILMNPA